MSEDRFTPEPWVVDGCYVLAGPARDPIICDAGGNDSYICLTPADMRLIAAAPDLLAACQFVKAFLTKLENATDETDSLREFRQKYHAPLHKELDAAIAKATKA